ncbi:MAG: hypothetical protein SGBAC_010552, partial [Bacillariaceae sp.]
MPQHQQALQQQQQQSQEPRQPTPKKSLCVANIFKYTKTEKIGLNLKLSNTMGRIYVSDIKRNSKFADTPLQIGMVVLTVNGKPCPRTVKETAAIVKGIEGDLTIVACSLKDPKEKEKSSSTAAAAATQAASRAFSMAADARRFRRHRRQESDEARIQRLNECLAPVEFVTSPSMESSSAMLLADEDGVEATLLDTSNETSKKYHDEAEDGDADDDWSKGKGPSDSEDENDWNEDAKPKAARRCSEKPNLITTESSKPKSSNVARRGSDKPRFITTESIPQPRSKVARRRDSYDKPKFITTKPTSKPRAASDSFKATLVAASVTAALEAKPTARAKRATSDSYAFSKAAKEANKQAEEAARGYESESSTFSLLSQAQHFTEAATSWLLGNDDNDALDGDQEFDAAYDTDFSRT